MFKEIDLTNLLKEHSVETNSEYFYHLVNVIVKEDILDYLRQRAQVSFHYPKLTISFDGIHYNGPGSVRAFIEDDTHTYEFIENYFKEHARGNCVYCQSQVKASDVMSFCGNDVCKSCEAIGKRIIIEEQMKKDLTKWLSTPSKSEDL